MMNDIAFMIANDFVMAGEPLCHAVRQMAAGNTVDQLEHATRNSFEQYAALAGHIADQGEAAWRVERLGDRREVYKSCFGEASAYVIPQQELSLSTQQLLTGENVDLSCFAVRREVLVVITTPEMDFGHTWTFFAGSVPDLTKEITAMFFANLAMKGLTGIFNCIGAHIGRQLTLNSIIGAAQTGMQAVLGKSAVIKFVVFAKAASLAAAALVLFIKIVAFIALVFLFLYIIDNVLFQKYQSNLVVYNFTDQDVVFKIPYLYNAAGNEQPPVHEVNRHTLTLKKMTKPGDFGDFQGIRVKHRNHCISIATLQVENNNTLLQGLGWVVKLLSPTGQDFNNIVCMLSVPRIGNTSTASRFDLPGEDYEGWFNDESGKNTDPVLTADHGRLRSTLSFKECPTDDGYRYNCFFILSNP